MTNAGTNGITNGASATAAASTPVPAPSVADSLRHGAAELREALNPGRRRQPPADVGIVVANVPFSAGREIRIRIVEDDRHAHPAVSFRIWEADAVGWWPLQGWGFPVSIRHLAEFAEATALAVEKVNELLRQREAQRQQKP
jgi:hypothetical protein